MTESELNLVIRGWVSTESGREAMMTILHNMATFDSTFNEDPYQHAFAAGVKHAGLALNETVKDACPSSYVKMLQEDLDNE